jgi:uncharacterized membrane protein YdjX (TVP38/TMEM64 family)
VRESRTPGSSEVRDTARTPWARGLRTASFVAIVVSLIGIARLVPIDRLLSLLAVQIEQLGYWGPLLFGIAYVVAAVLFVPGSALTLAAGAIFGLGWGTLTVSLAATTAAALAFLISRYLFRPWVSAWAERHARFHAIDRAIAQGGWKIIALLRLSPLLPFSLGNYLFGVTAIRFWPYVLASWIFMLPGTFLYIYLGYAGRAGLAAAAGVEAGWTAGQWAMLAIGLLATATVTVYISRLAARAIREQTRLGEPPPAAAPMPRTSAVAPVASARPPFALALLAAVLIIGAVWMHSNPGRLEALFGPPTVTMAEHFDERPGGPSVDHARFDTLLRRHVDPEGFVDYQALSNNEAELNAYLEVLASAPIDELGRNERLALLINAYNAYTLRLILDHSPLRPIRDIPADERWDGRTWPIGPYRWTLNQIEHQEIRPRFVEPRIHWALVCAAVGCPPLRPEAYTADRLEAQLEAQAIIVHRSDRWFRYDRERGIVHLSALYDWYGGDFEQVAGSILAYAARYADRLRRDLEAGVKPRVEFLPYDWALNDRSRRLTRQPTGPAHLEED